MLLKEVRDGKEGGEKEVQFSWYSVWIFKLRKREFFRHERIIQGSI
jgi:hypothetical protein